MQGDVETILGFVDVRRPAEVHVGSHQGLVADLQPAVHQPVLHLALDGHAWRPIAIGNGGSDLAAKYVGVELEGFAALAPEAQAGNDLHEISTLWAPEGTTSATAP